jgi:hypothetical protein
MRKSKNKARQQAAKYRGYFLKQRLLGMCLLLITIIAVKVLEGDATIAVFTAPLVLCLIFSKNMWLVN